MSITWLLLSALALAAPPERVERTFAGSGSVDGGNVSVDGRLVTFVSGGAARVIDTETWQQQVLDDCTVTSATPVPVGATNEVWVGCNDGTVLIYVFVGRDLLRATDDDGRELTLEATAGNEDVVAMHATADIVYAILDGNVASLTSFDPNDALPSRGATANFNWPGFSTSTIDGVFVHVAHDQALMSSIQIPGTNPQPSNNAIGLVRVDDLAPTSLLTGQPLALDRGDTLAAYNFPSRSFQLILNDSGLRAVGVSTVQDDEWAVVTYEAAAEVLPVANGQVTSATPVRSFPVSRSFNDIVVTRDGYALAGATDGTIAVMSNRPQVTLAETDLGSIAGGDSGTLGFTSDTAGDYVVRAGGDLTGGGIELDSGSVGAGGSVEVSYTVSSDWVEGDNDIFVLVTDARGRTGHGWARATVDAAPGRVSVDRTLSFGDQRLKLTFTALAAEDIQTYTVYVSDEAFEAGDYPDGGGPELEVEEPEFTAPLQLTDIEAGATVEVVVSPLENDKTYYLAVRATDALGKEGPMSTVVSGRPRDALTASERAGDPGGMACTGIGSVGGLWLGALGLGLVGLRRRRAGVVAQVAIVGTLLALAAPAGALAADEGGDTDDGDGDEETGPPVMSEGYQEAVQLADRSTGDLTKAWGNVELRYGYWTANEPSFEPTFGSPSASQLQFEIGPQLFRVVEVDLGGGLVIRNGETTAADDDASSGEETRLILVPMSLSITPRLHIVDEQPVVPYASFGGDWWLWREREGGADDAGKQIKDGSHFGWHWEVGINILLDTFDRRRASLLEAQAGINDSWLTLGYRRQTDLAGEGYMDFGGGIFHAGLKIDF